MKNNKDLIDWSIIFFSCISIVVLQSLNYFDVGSAYLKIAINIVTFILGLLLLIVIRGVIGGAIGAKWRQFRIGCFRGIWENRGLNKELKRRFNKANTVWIKVTRGTELFKEDNPHQIKEYLKILNKKAIDGEKIKVRFLMIIPCWKLKHVQDRYDSHKEDYEDHKDFLKSWYQTIHNIETFESNKLRIETRFYTGKHSHWRFYIFKEEIDRAKRGRSDIILFNSYDPKKSGTGIPMYKVTGKNNNNNIGDFMVRYFEEIWDESLTKEQFQVIVQSEECTRTFCERCEINSCKECKVDTCKSCELNDFCKKQVDSITNAGRS